MPQIDLRKNNPADMVRQLTEAINVERQKLEEALANISAYAEQLRRVAEDAGRRLLTRD